MDDKNDQDTIRITERAAAAMRQQLSDGEHLRAVFAGGCGAFGYRIAVARRAYPGDQVGYEANGLRVLLDPRAAMELGGAVIDFDPEDGFVLQTADTDQVAMGQVC